MPHGRVEHNLTQPLVIAQAERPSGIRWYADDPATPRPWRNGYSALLAPWSGVRRFVLG
jgi:hypothetical protein